ncbi:MAG: dephospho-CoA kinase [Gemmataceae bacterium]
MTRVPVIGLVGGVGSGKSAVAAALARRGGCVVDADALGHRALRQPELMARILARWPQVHADDGIDRRKLGSIVFGDAAARRELESIVHPWIVQRIRDELAACNGPFAVVDAPLLLEAGLRGDCDLVAFVDVPAAERARRVATRGWSADELARREAAQMPLAEKRRLADIVVNNAGSPQELDAQVERLLERLPERFCEASRTGTEGGRDA